MGKRKDFVGVIPAEVWYELSLFDQSLLLLVERFSEGKIERAEYERRRADLDRMKVVWESS